MNQPREELVQQVFEKIEKAFRGIHDDSKFHSWRNHGPLGARGGHLPFQDLDLNKRQIFFILILARSKDGMSVKDIARFMHVSPGAVTQFIDMLIEKNLVQREEDPDDRRGIKVKLSEFARSKFANFKRGFVGSLTPYFDNFSDEELSQFVHLLDKIGKPVENP